MKKILSLIICAVLVVSSMCTAVFADTASTTSTTTTASSIKFTDVDENTPEGKAIYKLAEAGVVNGNGDGTFAPSSGLTRAQLCKMINLVFGYTQADTVQFSDVSSTDWFAPYVLVAKKAGYITGYEDGTFRGNNNITRQEFCAILCRVVNVYDLGLKADITDEVSPWAYDYVNKIVTNSIMPLESGRTFRATQIMKRSEIAVVLANYVKVPAVTPTVTPSTGSVSIGGGGGRRPSGGGGGGGSSGGSSSGKDDKEDDKDTSDDEIQIDYKELNKDIIARLTKAKTALSNNKNKFRGTERDIITKVISVIEKILNDSDKYEISFDTVFENYTDDITDTYLIYSEMPELSRSNFKTKVADIDEDTFDFLVEFFGISDDL